MRGIPVIEGFEDLETIGRGGTSTVFSATQTALGRRVAIKVLHLDAGDEVVRRRFLRECRAVGLLAGVRGITPVHMSAFTEDGRPCIVMEHMGRGTLDQHVRQSGPLTFANAYQTASILTEALVNAHDRRLVHRDIKPGNVLISSNGTIGLADFGIAVIDDLLSSTVTSESLTPPYAPPESLNGEVARGPAADIYSLGATIYFALTGRAPFGTAADGGVAGLSMRVAHDPVPPIERAEVPSELEQLLQDMLAKRPEDRPHSMRTVAARLRAVAAEGGLELDPDNGVSQPPAIPPPPNGPTTAVAEPQGISWIRTPTVERVEHAVDDGSSPVAIDWLTQAFVDTPADGDVDPSPDDPSGPADGIGPTGAEWNAGAVQAAPQDQPISEVEYPDGGWPTSTDYARAVQDPMSLKHTSLTGAALDRDLLGMPVSAGGQSAVVFQLSAPSGQIALRCFTRPPGDGALRYRSLAHHLRQHPCPPLVPAEWLDHAVEALDTSWPAVRMPWVPGVPLDVAIEDRLDSPGALLEMAERWLDTCDQLRAAQIAHADLQHGNILVDDDLTIRLIDLDGVWIPALSEEPSRETGHPGYQHPWRDAAIWGPDLDSFSGALIHTTLIGLAAEPGLWRHHVGENLVLSASDLRRPGGTPAWLDLLSSPDERVRRQALVLEQCCSSSDPPVGSVRDLVDSAPLFATPAPTTDPTSVDPIDLAAPFVPVTPVVDNNVDWAGGPGNPVHQGNPVHHGTSGWVTNPMPHTAPAPVPMGSRPVTARPIVSRSLLGGLCGLIAAIVAVGTDSTPEGRLTLPVFAAVLAAGLCLSMGWLGERASSPRGAARWAVQTLTLIGPLIAGALLVVDSIAQGLPGDDYTTEAAGPVGILVVALCTAVIVALVGLTPLQWLSFRSAGIQTIAGLTGGAVAGVLMATLSRAITIRGSSGIYVEMGPMGQMFLGGLVAGALIGCSLGIGHMLASRRCLVPQSGWRPGRLVDLGSRPRIIGAEPKCHIMVPDPGVMDVHAQVEPWPGQRGVDQIIPLGSVWLDGHELSQPVVLPYGETTFHLGRPDGPAVSYRSR